MTGTKNITALFLTLAIALIALVSSVSADPVYYSENGHYYEAIYVPDITWDEANTTVQSLSYLGMKGHLATINNADENNFIFSNLNLVYSKSYLIGAFQPTDSSEPDGGWQWVTGEPWSYTNWYQNEPNNEGEENWAAMLTASGAWNDVLTGDGYIVEYELKNLTITDYNLNYLESSAKWESYPPKEGMDFMVWPPTGLDAPYMKKISINGVTTKKNQIYGVSTDDYEGTTIYWGECVSFVKALSHSKVATKDWVKGKQVIDTTNLAPGTVIATFDSQDKYGSVVGKHAAIFRGYVRNSKGELTGIQVWDQNFVQKKTVGRHTLPIYKIANVNDQTSKLPIKGENGAYDYYVVQVP